jgi:type II secretory pathway predicted ATPase ExeA
MIHQFRQYIRTGPYEEILTGILTAMAVSEGVIKLSGKAGVGKTALCERLGAELEKAGHEVILLLDPPVSSRELEQTIGRCLGLQEDISFTRGLTNHLLERSRLVLIFNDAERISRETFQAMRLIANIQDNSRSLVQMVLCGSPGLDEKLASPAYRSLAQYLSQSFRLRPMKRCEVSDFCRTRMGFIGLGRHGLGNDAVKRIHSLTGGYPGEVLQLWDGLLEFREILPSIISGRAIRHFVRDSRQREPRAPVAAFGVLAGAVLAVSAAFWWFGS